MTDLLVYLAAVAATCGLLSHLFYFIHGERHTNALAIVKTYLLLPPASVAALYYALHLDLGYAFRLVSTTVAAFTLSLWTSILVHRVFFHRLNKFPGPPLAKLSKFYHALSLLGFDNYRVLAKWHDRYGDIVRTGPNEVTVISKTAQTTILGPQSRCLRSGWSDHQYGQDLYSLHAERDVHTHMVRRRIWDRGFSMKALRGYEHRIVKYTNMLISQLSDRLNQPVEASRWFNLLAFDVMGDLAFGESFHNLSSGQEHPKVSQLHRAMFPVAILSPILWMIPVFVKVPIISRDFTGFVAWCTEQVEKRRHMKVEIPDIASWLLQAYNEGTDPVEDAKWLHGDSRLVVVAGSDTVTASLTFLFYHLASEPAQVAKLRKEIDELWPEGEEFEAKNVLNAEHLNAVIHESLRMHPPTASGVSRVTPKEGVDVDGVWIPGEVTISVPNWAIGRSSKHYHLPNSFIPERWTTQPNLLINREAFAPFSLGPFNCIGRNLALLQLRTAICLITRKFDISLATSMEEAKRVESESVDNFTMSTGPLWLVFRERGRGKGEGEMEMGENV